MSLALGNTINNIINVDGSGDVIISSIITGANPLTKEGVGTGVLRLTGTNTYTGLTTVNTGTLQLNKSGGTLPSSNNVVVNNSGTLQVSDNQTLAKLTIAAGGNIIVDSGKTLTISDTFTLDTGAQISGGGTISYASGKLIYTGSSTIIAGIEWPTSSAPSSVNINTGATVILDADKTTTIALIVDGTLNAADKRITGTGFVNINGTLITANLNGLLGTGATFTGATPVLGTASIIDYAATSGIQSISASPSYANVTFSGGGTKKTVNATENISGVVTIKDNTTVDSSLAAFGSSDTSLTMSDTSKLIVGAGTDPKPRMGNVYNLSSGSTIEFTGNSTSIRLQNTKTPVAPISYSNLIVNGTGVSNESTVSGINFRNGGSFVIKSGATFKLKNSNGFSGATNTAVSNVNNSNNSSLVTLEMGSTVQYNSADQTVTNQTPYSNLTISGSGTKTAAAGNLVVNNMTNVSAGTLLIPKTDDAVAANVFYAHKGITTTGGNLILENNAQLLQDDDADNTNAQIQSQRYIAEMDNISTRLDFVYWGSPVTGQKIKSFSPATAANCFLQYRESDDKFTITTDADFQAGKGYAIGAESGTPADSSPVPDHPNAYAKTYKFGGIPNNGNQAFASLKWTNGDHGYNLVGNPYPSNINFDALYALNNASTKKIYNTAWFWTNVTFTATQMGSNYEGNNYATYNGTGGTPPTYDHAAYTPNLTPNGIIKVGQGFIVQAKSTGKDQPLNFNNSIRVADKGVFFQKSDGKNRFWLTMESPDKLVNTVLIGYIPGATNGFDPDFDSDLFVVGSDTFYSVLGAAKLAIQGRSEMFSTDYVVPLGNVYSVNGSYTISMQNPEGFFESAQKVYLQDKLLNKYIDLSSLGSYTFTASKGIDDNRFQVVYKDNISLSTTSIDKSAFDVFRKDHGYVVKSSDKLGNIDVYDAGGKLIMKTFVAQKEFLLDASVLPAGVYIIRAENSGNVRSRKIIR